MKKAISLILVLLIFLMGTACGKSDENLSSDKPSEITQSNKGGNFNLLYSSSDSFNPYKAETDLNRNLSLLVFDPLVKLDNNFEANYILAEKITLKGKKCTVTLKDVKFSDGTPLTADDVVYSYNLAKSTKTKYLYQLYEVKSVKAQNDKTVVFNLSRKDIYFQKLLTFPIIKAKSDKKTDVDGRVLCPVGTGRYTVNEEKEELSVNKKHFGILPELEKITLINAPDPAAVSHYVEIGTADMYYTDISDGSIVRMSGKKQDVNLLNFVYLGMNESYGQLSTKELRYAISSAINRTALCKDAYHNNALAATGFFSPVIKDIASVQNLETVANTQISIENLERIGYNRLDSDNYRINSSGNRIRLTLLVNKENESRVAAANLIAEQLRAVGIQITVLKRSYSQYVSALKSKEFQLYIGEIETLANMDLYELTVYGGRAAYGIKKDAEKEDKNSDKTDEKTATVKSVIEGFYSGKNTIADVATRLQTEMPVIPLCYRKGLLFYSDKISNVKEVSASDIYFSFSEYIIKK